MSGRGHEGATRQKVQAELPLKILWDIFVVCLIAPKWVTSSLWPNNGRRTIKRDVHAVWLAESDPRTPWFAKVLALAAAAYAISPIDLIPDFIPVIGYLDDFIIVPLGIMLVVRLIPPELMDEHREAASKATERPVSHFVAGMVIAVWIACAVLLVRAFL